MAAAKLCNRYWLQAFKCFILHSRNEFSDVVSWGFLNPPWKTQHITLPAKETCMALFVLRGVQKRKKTRLPSLSCWDVDEGKQNDDVQREIEVKRK